MRDAAFRIRRKYVYEPSHMNLLTWTNILERLKPSETVSILDGVFGEGIEFEEEKSTKFGEYVLTIRRVG